MPTQNAKWLNHTSAGKVGGRPPSNILARRVGNEYRSSNSVWVESQGQPQVRRAGAIDPFVATASTKLHPSYRPDQNPTAAPSKNHVPVTPASEEVPPPTPSVHVEATVLAPIVTPDSGSISSTSIPVSVSRPNSSRALPYHALAASGWSRPTSTSELRSAEMIRQHELSLPVGRQSASRSAFSSYRPYSAPSPTRKKPISQSNAKYQVEMQYVRSAIATSAARGTRTRPVSVTRSPSASSRSRR